MSDLSSGLTSEPNFHRTLLVPADSDILHHATTLVLHTYPTGEVLVQTAAPSLESTAASAELVTTGVCWAAAGTAASFYFDDRHFLDHLDDREVITAYIELIGPVDPAWLTRLDQLAIELLQFQPEHSFLSRGPVRSFRQALQQPFVSNVVPIDAGNKPQSPTPESGEAEVWIVVRDRGDRMRLMQELAALPEVFLDPTQAVESVGFYLRLRARVSAPGQATLLHHPDVLAVEPYSPVQPEDEVSGLILAGQYDSAGRPQGSYLRWLENHGLNGAGVTIGIVDAGVDAGHPAFTGRIKPLNPDRKSWHGTFVAGHAAGCYLPEKDGDQFIYGLGIAPKADLLIQDNQSTPTALCRETVTETGVSGQAGTVQNNSWGAGTKNPMDYGSQEATYDRLVRNADPDSAIAKPLTICFSAGNSGANGLTRPKSAKNIIVTGNSENYRPAIGKEQSDNIDELYNGPRGSSHGNCGDGRIVPHLVAPGEWTASANYDSNPGEKEYISPHLTWGSGTSAASPKTAGACALLIQWWRQHNDHQDPSPALLKALLVNGAEPLRSAGFIPNPLQGWGRLNLENVVQLDVQHIYVDQTGMLKQRGDQQTWKIRAVNPHQPVKVTLCWTDPPGALGTGTNTASAIVNKLALRLEQNGALYRGNQFQNGWSYSSGLRDREGWDNLQNIFLAPGAATGSLQVSVTALEITTNCLSGKIDVPQQDFALVISNAVIETAASSVFVGVDPNAQIQPKPKTADSYWAPGNQDRQDLDHDWWQTVHTTSKPSPKPLTQSQVEAWWLQDDVVWNKPESDRTALPAAIVESLQAGISLITTGKPHQVVMARSTASESRRDGKADGLMILSDPELSSKTTETRKSLALPLPIALSESLNQLMQNWTQFGSLATLNRVAVLLIGAGTRLTCADLLAMRRLAHLGQLHLVSDDAQLLSFLVQRVHRTTNLFCHLAKDVQALPTLFRDTIVEASGGQQLAIDIFSHQIEDQRSSYASFAVTHLDQHLTLQLQFPPDHLPNAVLYRPGHPAIDLLSSESGMQITAGEGVLQLDCSRASLMAGTWKLLLRHATPEATYRVRAWAWSDLHLAVTQKPLTSLDARELLMTVRGAEGVTFNRLQGQPRLIQETAGVAAESTRSIEVTATEPRAAQRSTREEASRAVQAPQLGTVVRLPQPQAGAVVLDLPLWIEGTDPYGARFIRLIRQNLIQLEPRSHWRQRLCTETAPLLTAARIVDVERQDGELIRLTLQRGARTRAVQITSPILRTQLEWLLQHAGSDQEWFVAVMEDELYSLARLLK